MLLINRIKNIYIKFYRITISITYPFLLYKDNIWPNVYPLPDENLSSFFASIVQKTGLTAMLVPLFSPANGMIIKLLENNHDIIQYIFIYIPKPGSLLKAEI